MRVRGRLRDFLLADPVVPARTRLPAARDGDGRILAALRRPLPRKPAAEYRHLDGLHDALHRHRRVDVSLA